MELLNRLSKYAITSSKRKAFINSNTNEAISYEVLNDISDRLAAYIQKTYHDKVPIVVYGHKSPLMIASFLGCVKAGHPYCPVDISMPDERL